MKTTKTPTLCIGIDVAWWGGSGRLRASQCDTIVAGLLGENIAEPLHIEPVVLSRAPNARASDPTEPNFDADGHVLTDAIAGVMARYAGRFEDCVVALDAPLVAKQRAGQQPRKKAVGAGEAMGSKRRDCEDVLSSYMHGTPAAAAWSGHVRIQSGSPISPRIASICSRLSTVMNFAMFRPEAERGGRRLLEIFPSEAIWALGSLGYYGDAESAAVRAYKASAPRLLVRPDAFDCAQRPLLGFVKLIASSGPEHVCLATDWVRQIAEYACAISVSPSRSGYITKGKGYDDPIESGTAFFTAFLFIMGEHHVWGDGHDGVIVGPGILAPASATARVR